MPGEWYSVQAHGIPVFRLALVRVLSPANCIQRLQHSRLLHHDL